MTKSPETHLSGVALWRQIADGVRLDIVGGKLSTGAQLPTEAVLAERFQANRHTVRRALSMLQDEGVIRSEQGRGSFVQSARRLSYRIGKRTRFSEGLAGQAQSIGSDLLSHRLDNATAPIAMALGLKPGAKTVRLDIVSQADGIPMSRATIWLDYRRFPDFAVHFGQARSITAALRRHGVPDYARLSTRLSARHADPEETALLRLTPGAIVLVSEAIDAQADGTPVLYALSRFPAERLELVV